MAHLKTDATKAELTPKEWLRFGSQMGEVVNIWAGRNDLATYVGPGAGGDAPACFNPILAEVEVNIEAAFGIGIEAGIIGDFRQRETQREWPKASGAVLHEALHARFTKWSLPAAHAILSKPEYEALELLEESRIEAFGVKTFPKNREFLRASALEIVLGDIADNTDKITTIAVAARIAGLLIARIDAGVLDKSDVGEIPDILETVLGEDLIKVLRNIWSRAQTHEQHSDATYLYDLAREWVQAITDKQKEKGEQTQEDLQQSMEDLMEMLSDLADDIGFSVRDALDEEETSERWQKIVHASGKNSAEQRAHEREAQKVLADKVGPNPDTNTNSRLTAARQPSSEERTAAVHVASWLDKAKYRERSETVIKSVTPPGRLRARALVQGAAAKSKGVMVQPEAWRKTARKHTDDPTLKIGVMVDISGSMSDAMEPMAVTAWVLSEAAKRAQAKAAMVYYGSDVFATLKPGQHLDNVKVYSAPDGTEKFDKAFKTLDGSLNLLHSDGARMLVIVSDGQYTSNEREAAREWVKRCSDAGVAVIWVTYDSGYYLNAYVNGTSAVVVRASKNTSEVAELIGKAAAKALTQVSQRAA